MVWSFLFDLCSKEGMGKDPWAHGAPRGGGHQSNAHSCLATLGSGSSSPSCGRTVMVLELKLLGQPLPVLQP